MSRSYLQRLDWDKAEILAFKKNAQYSKKTIEFACAYRIQLSSIILLKIGLA